MQLEVLPFLISNIGDIPLLLIISLLRIIPQSHPIEHNPKSPNIGLERIIILPQHKLRRHKLRRPRNNNFLELARSSKAKINNLNLPVLIDQDILRFDIAVGHPMAVQVDETFAQLLC